LALGAVGDAAARPVLLAAMKSPSWCEAIAAAFALGALPAKDLADLIDTARIPPANPPAWLLRAALCSAGVRGTASWIEALDVSPAERGLLAAGGFPFAQFPVFAARLRERARAPF